MNFVGESGGETKEGDEAVVWSLKSLGMPWGKLLVISDNRASSIRFSVHSNPVEVVEE